MSRMQKTHIRNRRALLLLKCQTTNLQNFYFWVSSVSLRILSGIPASVAIRDASTYYNDGRELFVLIASLNEK
jgi:hypothetical protein